MTCLPKDAHARRPGGGGGLAEGRGWRREHVYADYEAAGDPVWVGHRPGRARLGMGVGAIGAFGSNAHPKAGSSWPMVYP